MLSHILFILFPAMSWSDVEFDSVRLFGVLEYACVVLKRNIVSI